LNAPTLVGDEKRSRDFFGSLLYNNYVTIKSSSHAVYETQYYLVWCPKYWKQILVEWIQTRVKEILHQIGEQYEIEIGWCEIAQDHAHLLISFLPPYSVAQVVGIPKAWSGSIILEEYPWLKKKLWVGYLWEQVPHEVICNYIKHHSFSSERLRFESF